MLHRGSIGFVTTLGSVHATANYISDMTHCCDSLRRKRKRVSHTTHFEHEHDHIDLYRRSWIHVFLREKAIAAASASPSPGGAAAAATGTRPPAVGRGRGRLITGKGDAVITPGVLCGGESLLLMMVTSHKQGRCQGSGGSIVQGRVGATEGRYHGLDC